MFLLAATLRTETVYGQTNCWVLPGGQYGVYRGPECTAYIMAPRSARIYSYQVRSKAEGAVRVQLACLEVAAGHRCRG